MKLKKKDKFLTSLLQCKYFNIKSKKEIKNYENTKSYYLLILKTSEKLNLNEYKNFLIQIIMLTPLIS